MYRKSNVLNVIKELELNYIAIKQGVMLDYIQFKFSEIIYIRHNIYMFVMLKQNKKIICTNFFKFNVLFPLFRKLYCNTQHFVLNC